MDIAKYIENIASKGCYHFTIKEAAKAMGSSHVAASAALRRLRLKGSIAMPHRGFNVIVPPEYRRLGCLPPEQFIPQLMGHLDLDYYVGLLSAAEMHGAAHQRPQVFQVVVAANRPFLRCGEVRVQFIARHNVRQVPAVSKNTARGYMKVSMAEATAFDLVGYVRHCGGLNNAATVLAELAESMTAERIARIAPLSPVPWAQRLGYLLEIVSFEALTEPLALYVAQVAKEYVTLNPKRSESGCDKSPRWKLVINENLDPDL